VPMERGRLLGGREYSVQLGVVDHRKKPRSSAKPSKSPKARRTTTRRASRPE
jgi:hypothetical protein